MKNKDNNAALIFEIYFGLALGIGFWFYSSFVLALLNINIDFENYFYLCTVIGIIIFFYLTRCLANNNKDKIDNENNKPKIDINKTSVQNTENIINTPPANKTIKVINSYDRNINLKDICISRADFLCEINNKHKTFISKNTGKNYVEAHHIIPLKFQKDFNYNIDTLENLVCLCPNCHKAIHYGSNTTKYNILCTLYNLKRPFNIDFKQLLMYYLN